MFNFLKSYYLIQEFFLHKITKKMNRFTQKREIKMTQIIFPQNGES